MPVLKTYKNGVWEPVSGMSEHTHTKNDITDLQEKVYTQPDEPVDAPIGAVWVDTDEDVGFGGSAGGGSASIDVTASVGQTIVVEEVDANGKPTKWKAAEYQPRTHYCEVVEILPETTAEIDAEAGFAMLPEFTLENGVEYTVKYNGTEYDCICYGTVEEENGSIIATSLLLGNILLITETGDNGIPFCVLIEGDYVNEYVYGCIPFDGSTSVTLSIVRKNYAPIPLDYVSNAFPCYIDVTGSGTDDDPYAFNCNVDVMAAYRKGREIKLRLTPDALTVFYYNLVFFTQRVEHNDSIFQFVSAGPGGASNPHISVTVDQNGNIAKYSD